MRSCCELLIQETADSCKAAAVFGRGGGGYRKIDEPNDEQLKFTRSLGQDRYIITQQIISTALAELAL